jgi:predicted phage tail protein
MYYWRVRASNISGTGPWSLIWCFKTFSTPQQKIQMLITTIDSLVNAGILGNGNGNSLKVKLNGALEKINQEQYQAAINKLNAFNNEVQALIQAEKLTPVQGQYLIDGSNAIIQQISGDNVERINAVPQVFKLYQNYPNPFNPSTSIKFDIPKESNVKLIVYDVLGREITVLMNYKIQAGSYEVIWDGTDQPSGVYFFRMITNEYVETKKMVLIK